MPATPSAAALAPSLAQGDTADSPPLDAAPPVGDLLAYAGMEPAGPGGDDWAALVDSDDPAVSALARWWGPVS